MVNRSSGYLERLFHPALFAHSSDPRCCTWSLWQPGVRRHSSWPGAWPIRSMMDLLNTKIIYRYLITQVISKAVPEELGESFKSKSSRTRFMKTAIPIYLQQQANPAAGQSSDQSAGQLAGQSTSQSAGQTSQSPKQLSRTAVDLRIECDT